LQVSAALTRQEAEYRAGNISVSPSPSGAIDADAYTEVSMTDYPETEPGSGSETEEDMAQLMARINSLANAVDPRVVTVREPAKRDISDHQNSSVAGYNLIANHAQNRRDSIARRQQAGAVAEETGSEVEDEKEPERPQEQHPGIRQQQKLKEKEEEEEGEEEEQPQPQRRQKLQHMKQQEPKGISLVAGRRESVSNAGRMAVGTTGRRDPASGGGASNKFRVAVKMQVGAFALHKGAAKRMAKSSVVETRRSERRQAAGAPETEQPYSVRAHSESLLGQTRH